MNTLRLQGLAEGYMANKWMYGAYIQATSLPPHLPLRQACPKNRCQVLEPGTTLAPRKRAVCGSTGYLLQAAPDGQGTELERVHVRDLAVDQLPDSQPLMERPSVLRDPTFSVWTRCPGLIRPTIGHVSRFWGRQTP